VTVLPEQFNGVVADSTNPGEDRSGHGDEPALRAMALAHRARAIAAQIFLFVVTHMAIVPSDAHRAARFNMVDLGWKCGCHEAC
jgi:hypothetical protein